jgi:deoxyadenosine/deoxycytidine kinase
VTATHSRTGEWIATGRHHAPRSAAAAVAVVGIDGSGKSTVSRELARRLSGAGRVCCIGDELECYEHGRRGEVPPLATEMARRALGRYAKKARSLAGYKLPKLAELLLRDRLLARLHRRMATDLVVMDGSPLVNLAAWSVLYGNDVDASACAAAIRLLTGQGADLEVRARMYMRYPDLRRLGWLLPTLHLPTLVIMTDLDPALAMRRIESRGASRQVHELEACLTRLRSAYVQVLDVVRTGFDVRTHVLDASAPLDAVVEAALDQVRRHHIREALHA